jgi:ABC-type Fe3+-hydroxamate transport system substrate-binding protein
MNIPPKIYFISNSGNSSLSEFINSNLYYESFDVSFKQLKLENLKKENPDIIVFDLYFQDKQYDEVIADVMKQFENKPIYFLSPKDNNFKKVAQVINTKLHLLTNFSGDVIGKINHYLNQIYSVRQLRVG